MRLMNHLIGNGPAPLVAAGVMAASIALSAGTQAAAVAPEPVPAAPVAGSFSEGTPARRA
jgi:hypothetical protein